MKTIGVSSTLFVLLVATLALCVKSDGFITGLIFVPFALGPLLVSLKFAFAFKKRASQVSITMGSALYAIWFSLAYLDIFYWHVDANGAIGLLFVGLYSLPVMLIVWLFARYFGRTPSEDIQA
jgi:hypothetical protein